jgi:hypothetical protein
MFYLLNWLGTEDINLVCDEDGVVKAFKSEEEAKKYGNLNLNWDWKVVEV